MADLDLFVVRHAVAFEKDPDRWPDDAKRPLTPDGEKDFRKAARGIARALRRPVEVVFASPWVRAWRTAEILNETAGWGEPQRLEALAGDRDADDALRGLAAIARDRRIAIVGHEPMLSTLCGVLIGGAELEVGKGALLRLSVQDLQPGGATLDWLLQPKVLRRLAG